MTLTIPDSFLNASEATWLEMVDRALKGTERSRLVGLTEDGQEIEPLYARRHEGAPYQMRPAQKRWDIVQRIDRVDPKGANGQILEDLQGGASGLELVFATSTAAGGLGIHLDDLSGMQTLLDGVLLDLVQLRLIAGHEGTAVLSLLIAYAERSKIDAATLNVNAGIDYLGWLAMRGKCRTAIAEVEARVADATGYFESAGLRGELFLADGRIWHGAGATQAEELACAFATAVHYMRVLENAGVAPESWAQRVGFTLVADTDQLGTIAKARAARRIWASLLEACDLQQQRMNLHMQTSYRMLTRNDPWVNMLRSTVAAFSAGIGGADSITVLPFTQAIGLPDGFARRLARNTQSILLEESNLHMVADPSAGSGAIEARTDGLVAATWEKLQQIDAEGGLLQSLTNGKVQARIQASRERRQLDVALRRRPITGVSEFPDLNEKGVEVLDERPSDVSRVAHDLTLPPAGSGQLFRYCVDAGLNGTTLPEINEALPQRGECEPIEVMREYRLSEGFEELRDVAASAAETRPVVFLACLGSRAQFAARASWVSNAFATGGLTLLGGAETTDIEALMDAFRGSGAKIACIVSSDKVYEVRAAEVARELAAAGAIHLYLAGKPGDHEEEWRAAGVGTFVHAGCNLLDVLKNVHQRLGLVSELESTPVNQEISL